MEDELGMEKRREAVTILLEANERTRSTQASTADRQASINSRSGRSRTSLERRPSDPSPGTFKKTVIAIEGERSSQFVSRVRKGGDRGEDVDRVE